MAYHDRIAQGLCGKCGKKPETPGAKMCNEHREEARVKAAAARAKRQAAKACLDCGDPLEKGSRCETCKAKAKVSRQKSNAAKKAAGICVQTGCHEPVKEGCTLCQTHLNKLTETSMKHYHRRKAEGTCLYCDQPPLPGQVRCQHHVDKQREYKKATKKTVFDAYGGPVCVGCGCDDADILEIDHIDGGGNEHRRQLEMSSGSQFYLWLRKNNFPSGFRVLCPTCNKKAHRGLPLPSEQPA